MQSHWAAIQKKRRLGAGLLSSERNRASGANGDSVRATAVVVAVLSQPWREELWVRPLLDCQSGHYECHGYGGTARNAMTQWVMLFLTRELANQMLCFYDYGAPLQIGTQWYDKPKIGRDRGFIIFYIIFEVLIFPYHVLSNQILLWT